MIGVRGAPPGKIARTVWSGDGNVQHGHDRAPEIDKVPRGDRAGLDEFDV